MLRTSLARASPAAERGKVMACEGDTGRLAGGRRLARRACRRVPESILARAANAIGPLMLSRTGYQLMLLDSDHWRGQPLLDVMSDPEQVG